MQDSKSKFSVSSSDKEMVDLADDPKFIEGQEDVAMQSVQSLPRGRKPIPLQWSRIICVDELGDHGEEGFNVEDDMAEMLQKSESVSKKKKKGWKPLFEPKSFWNNQEKRDLESNMIGKRKLKAYGKDITEKRKLFINRAAELVNLNREAIDQGLTSADKLIEKLQSRGTGIKRNPYDIASSEYIEPTTVLSRYKGNGRKKLTLSDKIEIIHRIVQKHHPTKDVAKEFRISQQYVSALCSKTRKNPQLLAELLSEQEVEEVGLERTLEIIRQKIDGGYPIKCVQKLREVLKEEHEIEIKPWKLRELMVKELNMRYSKIKAISWKGNDPKNIFLRQQFALAFMKIDLREKTIINIDETWLGMSDFRRMQWQQVGKLNSVPKKQIQPRISMIVGLSTDGSVMTALLQANSNSSIMELFFTNFIQLMDKKNKRWRQETIIMLDNAPYHTSSTMMQFYNDNQIPVIFTGPHSYSGSPVELFFAHFKKEDINPNQLPAGKSNFPNVMMMTVQRIKQIPQYHRVLFWRHCLLYMFGYMYYQPL